MIESVQARQRGAYDFESHYDNLCALQDSVPLAAVKAHLSSGVLDINADRVRVSDWMPILNTIQINKSLEYIAVRSFFQPPSETDGKRAEILKKKTPAIRSKEITFRLCKALRDCLCVSPTIMYIELHGIPFRERDIQTLMRGILKNNTLVHLSFEYCRIGDTGLDIMIKGLKNSNNINSINLTGCSLSARGAELISKLIKQQGMRRHTEAWRDSLRYGQPDLDRMSGLRRINLNNNPLIGNQGAQVLAEALKDDLWVKALDMQGTGVSTAGAKAFLDVLKYNTTLVVLDLRRNPLIDRNILHSVMEQLMINCNGQETEYQWIEPEPEEQKPIKSKRKTTKVLNHSVGKKTTIKITPSSARRRTRSAGALASTRQSALDVKRTPGLPWRTAARANRYRGFPPERTPRKPLDDMSDADSTSVLITHEDSYLDPSMDTLTEMMEKSKVHSDTAVVRQKELRELQVELEQLRRTLRDERLARAKADQKVMQLMMENKRLEDDLRVAKLRTTVASAKKSEPSLQDESVLESIESSFKQFHAFLDMLREAGLGELITMAGLDQEQMPFSGNRTLNKSGIESFANSFRLQQAKGNGLHGDMDSVVNGNRKPRAQGDNLRPGNSRSSPAAHSGPTMGHIDEEAYLLEKQAADEIYQRLLRQTSGAFTGGITSSGAHSSAPVGKISSAPREVPGEMLTKPRPATYPATPREDDLTPMVDSPSDPTSARKRDPIPTGDADKGLKSPDDTLDAQMPRPVPTPRVKNSQGQEKDDGGKGEAAESAAERRVPSRASEANYSMDSFEQSYVSERGEVVVLGDDADLLESPNSRPINLDSDDDGDF